MTHRHEREGRARITGSFEDWLLHPSDVEVTREVVGEGKKFSADGTPNKFRGNTIICDVPAESRLGACASELARRVSAMSFASSVALLPPSSYHMTIMSLLNEAKRNASSWSKFLGLEVPIEEGDLFLMSALAPVRFPAEIEMRYRGLHANGSLRIELAPATSVVAESLASFRDEVAVVSGVCRPDHDSYVFHVSVAYRLAALSPAECEEFLGVLQEFDRGMTATGIFQLAAPTLAFFSDMHNFRPTR